MQRPKNFCPHCGWEIRESDKFCSNDGWPLVRAKISPPEIRTYLQGDQPFSGTVTVENIGVNPLRVAITPGSERIQVASGECELRSKEKAEFTITVDLTANPIAEEFLQVETNESAPSFTRIPVKVERPPQLALSMEPPIVFVGESWNGHLVVSHESGGTAVIKSGYCQGEIAILACPPDTTLSVGDNIKMPLTVDAQELPTGQHSITVCLELEGLGEQEFSLLFTATQKPNVKGVFSRLPPIMPERWPVRLQGKALPLAEIINDSPNVITISHVTSAGEDWLNVSTTRLPARIEPGGRFQVEVEINTRGRAGKSLNGSITFHWNRDQTTVLLVQVQVLNPPVYGGWAGVDFGTTNSCVCVTAPTALSGEPVMAPLDFTGDGRPIYIIPTAIHYPNPDNLDIFTVGEAARQKSIVPDEAPHTVLRVKRLLGSSEPLMIHGRPVSPTQIAAQILRHLLDRAEDHLKQVIRHAVVTVPASYSYRQMAAMLEACSLAGLENAKLDVDLPQAEADELLDVLDEPLAAALDYMETAEGKQLANDYFMIYDFGGGTLDVSLLHVKRSPGEIDLEVVAEEGRDIGGEDFTDMLMVELVNRLQQEKDWSDEMLPYTCDPLEWDLLTPAQQRQIRYNRSALTLASEELKIALSERRDYKRAALRLLIGPSLQSQSVDISFTRDELENLIREKVEATLEPVYEALALKAIRPDQLTRIVLTGGTSNIPLVMATLRKLGRPLMKASQVKECVARGALRGGQRKHIGGQEGVVTSGLRNKTSARYGLILGGGEREFIELVPKGVDLPTPWYEYPDPVHPEQLPFTARHPETSVPVARNRSCRPVPKSADVKEDFIQVSVPDARPRNPVPLRVRMCMDGQKILHCEVLAGEKRLDVSQIDL